MLLVLLWLLQDILTVFLGGMMQVPEIFLLGLVSRLLSEEDGGRVWAIWGAFAGGLLWDLRWIGIPGFYTLGYVVVVMLALWIWDAVPIHGRTLLVAAVLLEASQAIPPLLPVLILGGDTGGSFFLTQQLCALPALLLCLWLWAKRMKEGPHA